MRNIFHWKARHTVLSILCTTWIITYLERTVTSVAMPYIAADYHLSPLQSGVVLGAFFAGYSIFQIPGGLLADIFGVRIIATISILWRALFAALTGAAANFTQLLIVRVLFGLGDGLFPGSAFKTIAVWFPKRERTTANALMLALSELGTALAPLVMIPVVSFWGWRTAFYSLLVPGAVTALLFWTLVANKPSESSRVSREELLEIEEGGLGADSDRATKQDFFTILTRPDVLKYFFVVFAYDTAYWGYWSWLPTYLVKARGFSMAQMGAAASLPSFAGVIGCFIGGWASDKYFRNHRRLPIIGVQLTAAVLLYMTFTADTSTKMVIYETLAGFFLESFFSTFWALPMNTVPKSLMGITSGFINMAGQIAAFISPIAIGYLVEAAGGHFSLTLIFLVAAILASAAIVFMSSVKLLLQQAPT
jgi:sugar phosphate permease